MDQTIPDPDRCEVGWADWAHRRRCTNVAVCEVRLTRVDGSAAREWKPACHWHADQLFEAVAENLKPEFRGVWTAEMRPERTLREVLEYSAEIIPLARARQELASRQS